MDLKTQPDKMNEIVSLCKRRGFVFQSSEIYGGLRSAYDYGPLGVELKRNIAQEWWRTVVHERENVVGLDASIMMHPDVWKTSGHLANFSDPLVDCLNCKERFRADKAPQHVPGTTIQYKEFGKEKGKTLSGTVSAQGYVCPQCASPLLSDERAFMCMFRTIYGAIDPLTDTLNALRKSDKTKEEIADMLTKSLESASVYLRPETAQAMFVQFLNVQQSSSQKVPFGIAQQGKSFRNEIIVEHFIFRSCEFEQMELEFFCKPGTHKEWLHYWKEERMAWYKHFANEPTSFRFRQHAANELAHYSDDCYDVEYLFPWGWGELEGIASRTDYDLKKHAEASGVKLSYFDPNEVGADGKQGVRYTPYVIEPAAGLTRAVLCFLSDAYRVEASKDENGEEKSRVFLKLHPRLAPIKAAILPLVKKDGQPEMAREILRDFQKAGILVAYEDAGSIGKRYARHDEIGTPYAITIDGESLANGTVTLRDRDTLKQLRMPKDEVLKFVEGKLRGSSYSAGTKLPLV